MDESFYSQFHIVVCGLDSIVARRWLNGMIISLLSYNNDGNNFILYEQWNEILIVIKKKFALNIHYKSSTMLLLFIL